MREQAKKALVILLAVCFVLSATVVAVSAEPSPGNSPPGNSPPGNSPPGNS